MLTISPSMLCVGGGGVVYLVQGGVPGLGGVPGPGGCTWSQGGVPGLGGTWSRGVYLVWGVPGPRGVPGLGDVPGPGGVYLVQGVYLVPGGTWSGTPPCGQNHRCL